jgi:F0F1-type ATP synthase membrane subunit c/vacuolar-type H+-ATPase subunit K
MNIFFFLTIALCFSAVYSAYTRNTRKEILRGTLKIFLQFTGIVFLIALIIALLI